MADAGPEPRPLNARTRYQDIWPLARPLTVYPVALTAGEQAVWASDLRGQIWRINPDTATVSQTTPVGRGLVGLCATDGMLFAANNVDGTVVLIDAQDGRVVGIVPVGHAPTDVASWGGTIWVSIQSESAM
jgi:hypothetical protein